MLTLSKLTSAPRRVALSGWVRADRNMASSMLFPPALQSAFGLFDIAERVTHPIDLLVSLVPLARQQNDVIRLGSGNGPGNRLGTVGYDLQLVGTFNSGANFVDNVSRRLG